MTNIAEDFIKSKGLEEEYQAYLKQRENNANGIKVEFDIMLGDADGHHRETVVFTKHVVEEFRNYFECSVWGDSLKEVKLLKIDREWGPGATIYADQLQKLFYKLSIGETFDSIRTGNKHSLARFNFTASKEDAANWYKNEYYMEPEELEEDADAADFADDLNDFFNDMYFRYVKPYIDKDIFVRAETHGAYGISAC